MANMDGDEYFNDEFWRKLSDWHRRGVFFKVDKRHFTHYFWLGYRAYVLGGRGYEWLGGKEQHRITDKSIEPYTYFTSKQKREWQSGITYAKKERAYMRKFDKKPNNRASAFRRRIEKMKTELASGNLDFKGLSAKYDITEHTVKFYAKTLGVFKPYHRKDYYERIASQQQVAQA